MSTRLYIPNIIAAITPAASTKWDKASGFSRYLLTPLRHATSFSTSSMAALGVNNADILVLMAVSQPLSAQTISGTVKGRLRAIESNALLNAQRALVIRVVSSDGSEVRGTLLEHFPASATEFATALTNREFPPAATALSSVACQEGDRLVVEVGYRQLSAYASYTGGISRGDVGSTISPAGAPTVALAGTGAGNLSAGDYYYKITFYSANGETEAGTVSSVVTVVNPATDGKVAMSAIPTGGAGTVGRKIYRTTAGGSVFKLVDTIADNTTTVYEDNIADGSLGANAPIYNTTGDLPENETETGNYNGWIEFSGDLSFVEGGVPEPITPQTITSAASFVLAVLSGLTSGTETIGEITSEALFAWGGGTVDAVSIEEPEYAEIVSGALFDFGGFNELETGQITAQSIVSQALFTYQAVASLEAGDIKAKEILGAASFLWETIPGLTGPSLVPGTTVSEIISSAEFVFGGGAITAVTAATVTEGVSIGGAAWFVWQAPLGLSSEEPSLLGDNIVSQAAFVWDSEGTLASGEQSVAEIISEALFLWEGLADGITETEKHETWVLTGNGRHPSLYTGFNFNSFAILQGKQFGAKEDGIYVLEGDDDDGRKINTGLRIVTNFGTGQPKRLRTVDPGSCGENTRLRLKGNRNEVERTYSLNRGKFVASRDVQDEEMTLDFLDFDQLSQIKIQVLELVTK